MNDIECQDILTEHTASLPKEAQKLSENEIAENLCERIKNMGKVDDFVILDKEANRICTYPVSEVKETCDLLLGRSAELNETTLFDPRGNISSAIFEKTNPSFFGNATSLVSDIANQNLTDDHGNLTLKQDNPSSNDHSLSPASIIGIVVAAIAVLIIVAAVLRYTCKRKHTTYSPVKAQDERSDAEAAQASRHSTCSP